MRGGGWTLTQANEVDVDQLVPLKNAHDSGAWEWPEEPRRHYANDLSYRYHLLAVSRQGLQVRPEIDSLISEKKRLPMPEKQRALGQAGNRRRGKRHDKKERP